MGSQGTTPRGLHSHAIAFSAAADAVHSSELADPLPKYFLWGRTIELALKSFLLAEGETIKGSARESDGVPYRRGFQNLGLMVEIGSPPTMPATDHGLTSEDFLRGKRPFRGWYAGSSIIQN